MAAKKQSKIKSFVNLFSPSSGRGKFLLFVLVFAVIGGGYMAYRSFAAEPLSVRFFRTDAFSSKYSTDATITSITDNPESSSNVEVNNNVVRVIKVNNGGTAAFTYGGNDNSERNSVKDCFIVMGRGGPGPWSKVVIRSGGNTKTYSINAVFNSLCINYTKPSTTSGLGHSIFVKSGGPVYVWGIIDYWNPPPPSAI